MSKAMNKTLALFVALIAVVVAGGIVLQSATVLAQQNDAPETLTIEVSEDMYAFVFDDSKVHDDGMPAYGSAFVTQGYIYPEGTLNGSNGVLENGDPEFPDQVIGTWTCYGYLIGDGAHTETGAWVVSTQVIEFDETYDNATIVTQGMELADVGVQGFRAITGGTGIFNGASGQAAQTMTGFNASEGVVLSIELQFED